MPQQQGSSGGYPVPSLTDLLKIPEGAPPPPLGGAAPSVQGLVNQASPGQAPAPSHEETAAVVHHLVRFDQLWTRLLRDPDIGVKSIRPRVYDVMTDAMGEGLVTLPQVMEQLKVFPQEPLMQKKWVEQHVQTGERALMVVLDHYAAANPVVRDWRTEEASMKKSGRSHSEILNGVVSGHYSRGKKRA